MVTVNPFEDPPMKRFIAIAALAGLCASAPALAADVGVSVQISQPGVYGRIDIGRFPLPQVMVQQPVLVYQPRVRQTLQPVYMWVPPGHRQNWRQHCGAYGACAVPVYFVSDPWYQQQIRPRGYGGKGYEWRDDRRDHRRDGWRDVRYDRRDDRRDDRRGDGRQRGGPGR
jgi:hypothetical protein